MNDFTALVTQFGQWLQARNLDPKDYSLAIVARDQRALTALQGELTASVQREDWRPAWKPGGVEVHGITIETNLRLGDLQHRGVVAAVNARERRRPR
jgi:hypothetical protein